ncbi:MAG: response regulator [Alkalispirochaeta sp.]
MAVRVVVADDHGLVRTGIKLLIESHENYTVVGEAGDGATAVKTCIAVKPDVALLDVNMPITGGITAASEIRASCPDTGIVMLTFQLQLDVIRDALGAGAHGFVLKSSPERELFDAIERATRGERYIAQRAAEIVMDTFLDDAQVEHDHGSSRSALRNISGRERQVLQMLAEGSANNTIARTLNLSAKTVETYRSRLMHKLQVSSFAELVRVAVKAGLVDQDT